jgi:GT2 family glycosyltransferase
VSPGDSAEVAAGVSPDVSLDASREVAAGVRVHVAADDAADERARASVDPASDGSAEARPVAPLTVGVASRGRPAALGRCLRSLALLEGLVDRVVVVDDGSPEPLEPVVRAALADGPPMELRFVRRDPTRGLAAGRNTVAAEARSRYVLNLDDDAMLVSRRAVEDAVAVLDGDPGVSAIAFCQADAAGEPWPLGAQPAPVEHDARVAAFIGFAHLLRRSAFEAVGGYRERLLINGEERDLCLRLLHAGGSVVYLPSARVAHLADPAGRDLREYLHLTVRNGVLGALYAEPLPAALATSLVRLRRYFAMRKGWGVDDPEGFPGLLRRIAADLPETWRARDPVSWSTLRAWRRLIRRPPPYRRPASPASPASPSRGTEGGR